MENIKCSNDKCMHNNSDNCDKLSIKEKYKDSYYVLLDSCEESEYKNNYFDNDWYNYYYDDWCDYYYDDWYDYYYDDYYDE